ncbi:MAG: T9SS type A sorting domain-containing protein [Flavobacteriales bacterium]|nr:T9SS type A sorting domain-containing protein [Flavobacteriales bacterium]
MRVPHTLFVALLLSVNASAQFAYDAGIVDYVGLKYPCDGAVVPTLRIQNQGTNTMSTCVVETWKNGLFDNSFNWNLAVPAPTGATRQPALPVINGVNDGDLLEFRIISVNTVTDQDATDNFRTETINGTSELSPSYEVKVQVFTDGDPQETTWTIVDATGLVVASGGPYATINALEEETVMLSPSACYDFKLADSGGDGMDQRSSSLPGYAKVVGLGTEVIAVAGNDFSASYTEGLHAGDDPWAVNDAAINVVSFPVGTVCDVQFQPVVQLTNLGSATLNNVQVVVSIDNVEQYTTTLSGLALAASESTSVTLPPLTSSGSHTLSVRTQLPNGAADEVPGNDEATSLYNSSGQLVKVQVSSDANPGQISWTLYDEAFLPLASGSPSLTPSTTSTTSHCLPANAQGRYAFVLFDSFGDGIVGGSWRLLDKLDRVILQDNGSFTTQSPGTSPLTAGYGSHEFQLPLGPSKPWTASPYAVCGVFNLGLQSKVRCTTAAGAANYQWEFADPNAGYRRRVSSSMNYVTWMSMQAMPPQLGVVYFVRNRADQGAAGFADDKWGAGCEMGWSSSGSFCSALIATAGTTFSCGATRSWGGSSKIWATPVVGAFPYDANGNGLFTDAGDQAAAYHWRFTGAGGFQRDLYTASYTLPLTWATQPLVAGSSYQVQVEVQVAGVWRGFCGGMCSLTIAGGPAASDTRHSIANEMEQHGTLVLWPNPAVDGRINLRVDSLSAEAQQVTVDVFDATGRCVRAERFATSGTPLNTVLDLDHLGNKGIYLVILKAGDRTFTERFVME